MQLCFDLPSNASCMNHNTTTTLTESIQSYHYHHSFVSEALTNIFVFLEPGSFLRVGRFFQPSLHAEQFSEFVLFKPLASIFLSTTIFDLFLVCLSLTHQTQIFLYLLELSYHPFFSRSQTFVVSAFSS